MNKHKRKCLYTAVGKGFGAPRAFGVHYAALLLSQSIFPPLSLCFFCCFFASSLPRPSHWRWKSLSQLSSGEGGVTPWTSCTLKTPSAIYFGPVMGHNPHIPSPSARAPFHQGQNGAFQQDKYPWDMIRISFQIWCSFKLFVIILDPCEILDVPKSVFPLHTHFISDSTSECIYNREKLWCPTFFLPVSRSCTIPNFQYQYQPILIYSDV